MRIAITRPYSYSWSAFTDLSHCYVGPGGQNFFQRPEVLKDSLAYPAQLYRLDVMHGKFFEVMLGETIKRLGD